MTDDLSDDGGDGAPTTRSGDLSYEIDEGESPSEAVVRATATFTNTPILELEPLYDTIDPDHLDLLLTRGAVEESSITFEYSGCRITVTPDEVRFRAEDGAAN